MGEPGKYFEINVDVHLWGATPLNALGTIKSRISKAILRCGVVIEADGDEEMPEQILAAGIMSYLDPFQAPEFPPDLAAFLLDERNHKERLPVSRQHSQSQ